MSIYEKNLEAIKSNNQKLYAAIKEAGYEQESIQVEAESAKNGMLITKVIDGTASIYLNSQYNPEKEAVKYVEQYQRVLDYSVMFFLGFGNGIIVRELLQVLGEHVTFVFYEPAVRLFLHTIQHFDVTDIIQDSRIRLYVKGLNDEKYIGDWNVMVTDENWQICIFDALPKYRKLFPVVCKELEDAYCYLINRAKINIETSAHFGKDEAYNDIYNMRHFDNCNCEEDFEGIFPTDMPVILVAAGPSLEKNVMLLKEAKGKALIIAMDTILKYLLTRGIKPDLVVSADPRKSYALFKSEGALQIPLAMESSLNYRIVDLMAQQRIIFISSENPYYNSIFQLVEKNMYSLAGGGSVSTLAFSLAIAWGFRRLVLVGQDLALSPDKVHAGNSGHDHGRLQKDLIPVEGYYGDTVYTSPDYNYYLNWYNIVAENNKDIEVINATEGGANIRGSVKMSLREVIDTYCTKEFDFEQVILNVKPSFSPENKNLYINKWKESVNNLTELGYKLVKGVRLAEKGIKIIRKGKYSASEVRKIQNQINIILQECESIDEIYFVDCMVAAKEKDILGDIYMAEADNDEEYCRILEKLKKYMNSLEPAVEEVKGLFEKIIAEEDKSTVTDNRPNTLL